jgi:hypothetical protein
MFEDRANNQCKISPEFAARLSQLEPQEKVRVIVLLNVTDAEEHAGKRQSRTERRAAFKALQESAEQSLANIDPIIKNFNGNSLSERPNFLGSIPIEITAAGINALTESNAVKAIIEDQAIYPGHSNNSFEISFGSS